MRRLVVIAALATAWAAPPAAAERYRTTTGEAVDVDGFPHAAPAYAEFFANLPHGDELKTLTVQLAAPQDVPGMCGTPGMTACYLVRHSTIVAPAPQLDGPLLAHEYGHHVAMNRPLGPPRWASHAHVCAGLRAGRFGAGWSSAPAEAWADVYARLTYPELPWRLSPALEPDEPAFAAALHDVLLPPPAEREVAFQGRFGEGGTGVRRFTLPLRLDGPVEVELEAERTLRLDLAATGAARSRRSRTRRLRFTACRSAGERVVVTVHRRAGTGPFAVRARFRG